MKLIKDFHLDFEDQLFDLDCSLSLKIWKRNSAKVMLEISKIEGCKFTQFKE